MRLLASFHSLARFRGVTHTLVLDGEAHILRSKVQALLAAKGALKKILTAHSKLGFYSRYFLVSKKDVGFRLILDLRLRNHTLMKQPFRMLILKQILADLPRGLVFVRGAERYVLLHPDSPSSQIVLEIRVQRGGLSVYSPTIWTVSGSTHLYEMCGTLPPETEGSIYPELFQ